MALDIQHDRFNHHFHVRVDGLPCELGYTLEDEVMTITRTVVPPPVGGRGVAGELMRAALECAHAEGWKVRPTCSYAAAWMRRHPDYADLRA